MINIENDGISYIKSYVREINGNDIGPLELKYTKINSQVPKSTFKNTKFITNSLDADNNIRYLVPEIKCNNLDNQFCLNIDNIVREIEYDLRQKIVFYNPVKFQINFSELDNKFESESHLASTEIFAYYCLSKNDSKVKYSYPQALVKQLITNTSMEYGDYDFIVTLSQNESSYIMNTSELALKSKGYDLKLILYHEIIHGLGIKSEATGYPNYLLTYEGVIPSDYTPFVNEKAYLITMLEPTVYDSFVYNESIVDESLGEELQPMAERLPIIRDKIGQIPNQSQNLYALTSIISEEIESNFTVVSKAINGYRMVTNEGLYFKGQSYNIPLHVFENDFETGISISHTKHYDNEIEGDKVLLDWCIPNGKLLTDEATLSKINKNYQQQASIMGPEIMDMLHTIGWSTIDDTDQKNYTIEESANIFSLVNDSSATVSISFVTFYNSFLLFLLLLLWH